MNEWKLFSGLFHIFSIHNNDVLKIIRDKFIIMDLIYIFMSLASFVRDFKITMMVIIIHYFFVGIYRCVDYFYKSSYVK